ncbi:hypothetical protein NDU88_004949 [Pleurodeles waltl]|uniref:Uncharacterized protein n=1 Tax=Pleurodeles waltl TaxID=8319 RepID=A0AAV7M9U3_PLEWA|nr:hypothetical protein NDU88_004949 [Pleurodeles waltl]
MPPGGSRSPAEPTGAASRCASVLVPGATVLAAARLRISPVPHPRAGASAISQFPGLTRSGPRAPIFPARHSHRVSSESPDRRIFSPDAQASVTPPGNTRARARSAGL